MKIVIIGTGRMGFAQARLSRHFGDTVAFAVETNAERRKAFADEFGVKVYASVEDAPWKQDLDLVWIVVTDDEIANVARTSKGCVPSGVVCLHTSGARSASVISDELDNPCGSLHPLVACPLISVEDDVCVRIYAGVGHAFDGDEEALNIARILVKRLHAEIVAVPTGLKPMYHAAAVFASNYPLALADVSSRLFQACGFTESQSLDAAGRLLMQAAQAVKAGRPADVLTGPVKRHDTSTIESHQAILQSSPDVLALYNALLAATKQMVKWE